MKYSDQQVQMWINKQTRYPNSNTKIVRGSPDFMELYQHAVKLGYNISICKNKSTYAWVMSSEQISRRLCKTCKKIMNVFIVHDDDSDYWCEYCHQSCHYKYMCTRCRGKRETEDIE